MLDAQAPAVPADYGEIASAVLPCSVQDFYQALVSGRSSFWAKQHAEIGKQFNIAISGWKRAAVAAGPEAAAASASGAVDKDPLEGKTVFEFNLNVPGSGGYTRLMTFIQPSKPPTQPQTRCGPATSALTACSGGQLQSGADGHMHACITWPVPCKMEVLRTYK